MTGTGQKRDRPERFRRNPGACPHSVLTTRGMKGPLPGAKQNTVAKPPLPSIEHENRRLTETYPPGQRRTRIWEIRAQSEGLGVALTSSLNTGFYPSNLGVTTTIPAHAPTLNISATQSMTVGQSAGGIPGARLAG